MRSKKSGVTSGYATSGTGYTSSYQSSSEDSDAGKKRFLCCGSRKKTALDEDESITQPFIYKPPHQHKHG